MRPGPPAYPRRKLNPELRARVRDEMLNGKRAWLLSQLAGFPQSCDFSSILHAPRVPATPLIVERLQRLADILGFPVDAIFLPEDPQA